MDSESQPTAQFPVPPEMQPVPQPPSTEKPRLIAPVWHTIVIVGLILLNSYGGRFSQMPARIGPNAKLSIYGFTFLVQLVLVLFIWWGIRRSGLKMRELIGGRWAKPEDFLIDVGIAVGFWVISTVLRSAIAIALRLVDIHNPQAQVNQMKRALAPIIPQSGGELAVFLVLVIFAGFFEEIIFRGYLQQQLGRLAHNIWIGLILSAVIFGAAHGYQGPRLMVLIGIYGAMFGVLAVLRKNLRPGMMAHAGQDAFSGIAYFFLTKKGLL